MRLSATNVYHKMNTRNTLNMEQMYKLHDLGLAYIAERNHHTDCEYGVEELLQILPACIVNNKTLYSLRIYKNAFDVQCVAYKKDNEFLYGVPLDEIKNDEYPNQIGHLVDALYYMLLWVNETYPNELEEFKEKLQHYIQAQ